MKINFGQALNSAVHAAHPHPLLHSTLLLKTLRMVYTIFLSSKNTNVQIAAQTTVSQMVHTIFSRVGENVPLRDHLILRRSGDGGDPSVEDPVGVPSSQKNEQQQGLSELLNQVPVVRSSTDILRGTEYTPDMSQDEIQDNERIKDAYLVFRALCKLSMKPIPNPEG